jgi:hypothetical protein
MYSLFIALASIVLTFCIDVKSNKAFFAYITLIAITVASLVNFAEYTLK